MGGVHVVSLWDSLQQHVVMVSGQDVFKRDKFLKKPIRNRLHAMTDMYVCVDSLWNSLSQDVLPFTTDKP